LHRPPVAATCDIPRASILCWARSKRPATLSVADTAAGLAAGSLRRGHHSGQLSGLQHLTHLHVVEGIGSTSVFEPDALAGKTQLQHLEVVRYSIAGGSAGVAQLLSRLQPLQQLTYLDLRKSLRSQDPSPPAAAYSALTASSKLRHLGVSFCTLPAGVWQHILPAGRQLPKLQGFDIGWVDLASGDQFPAPEAMGCGC
jgi:hypothetical protein